jgi:polyisoprenoid-binding protein YceI
MISCRKYPSMTFKITGIKSLGNKNALSGLLTIRDVTKAVSIPLVYGGTVTDHEEISKQDSKQQDLLTDKNTD